MAFQIVLKSASVPIGDDLESQLISFLVRIGYLPENRAKETIIESVPYKLFLNCFLKRKDKLWEIDDMESFLGVTRATVYRHLNKLKSLDLVEEVPFPSKDTGYIHKGYRLRFSNLSRAWNFVEAHMEMVMEQYRKNVDSIQERVNRELSLVEEDL